MYLTKGGKKGPVRVTMPKKASNAGRRTSALSPTSLFDLVAVRVAYLRLDKLASADSAVFFS